MEYKDVNILASLFSQEYNENPVYKNNREENSIDSYGFNKSLPSQSTDNSNNIYDSNDKEDKNNKQFEEKEKIDPKIVQQKIYRKIVQEVARHFLVFSYTNWTDEQIFQILKIKLSPVQIELGISNDLSNLTVESTKQVNLVKQKMIEIKTRTYSENTMSIVEDIYKRVNKEAIDMCQDEIIELEEAKKACIFRYTNRIVSRLFTLNYSENNFVNNMNQQPKGIIPKVGTQYQLTQEMKNMIKSTESEIVEVQNAQENQMLGLNESLMQERNNFRNYEEKYVITQKIQKKKENRLRKSKEILKKELERLNQVDNDIQNIEKRDKASDEINGSFNQIKSKQQNYLGTAFNKSSEISKYLDLGDDEDTW